MDIQKISYTNEIKKLYDAVGWDEENQAYTGETKPVKWVRIHNLPDFVYFNHAQHAQVAKIECQTCHGPVEENGNYVSIFSIDYGVVYRLS